ncbi:MAG: tRNA1(Val) (adenine(37)-N6)-methyltransferase [Desulfobacterota bacterium]|nr:tRNA1(Val) (adenine(37)-N6)-methyltransferase [Thermodesulfobacteriota bacterium]
MPNNAIHDIGYLSSDETLDTMFQGKLKVIQKKRGYRFSLDAIILGRLAPVSSGDRVIDLGTGCGIIPCILATPASVKEIVGVELQEELAELAIRNVKLNGLTKKITVVKEDLKNLFSFYPPASFDFVVSNPPFRKCQTGRINPEKQKSLARHEITVSLAELLKVSSYLLKVQGNIFLIYPAFRLVDLFYEMRKTGIEPKALQCVHSRADAPAKMVLVEGVKGGGVELKVKEPLVIYDSQGNYTPALQAIYALPL